jgi:NAD(P)-dependent dehydrogenase (short-subunit alcohol dehydrogenase family)
MEKILIFGGSSKLGIQIIKHFLRKKNFFIISTYNKNNKSYLFKNNKNISFFFLDFLRKRQSINTVKKIFLKYQPDILIFNAAFLPKKKFFINITDKELINVFYINFFSYFFIMQYILKNFRNDITVISMLSAVLKTGGRMLSSYTASKAALWLLSKSITNEYKMIKFINLIFPSFYLKKSNVLKKSVYIKKILNKIERIIESRSKLISASNFIIK